MRPRYATRRRSDRPTLGPAVGAVAAGLGTPFLPWQRLVADVAGEVLEDGRPAYQTVVVAVGRRAGKSLLTLAELTTAALRRHRRGWYTAQARADAATTLRDEWAPILDASPLRPYVRTRLSNGSESFAVPRFGSIVRVFAPTPTALHGQSGDLIVFDEAWSHSAERGAELEVAARPLMATRPDAQLWILSAAGDVDSTWWLNWLDRGRAAAELDAGRGVAHFEWTVDGADVDLDDPAVWADAHPAVRTPANPTGTITLDWLEAEHALDPAAFRRTYLNVTDRAGTASSPIDPIRWAELGAGLEDWPRTGAMAAAVDCAPEQSATAIVVAGEHAGRITLELIDHRPGTGWAVDRLAELVDHWPIETVAIDRAGPAGALFDELELAGVPLSTPTLRDVAAAAARLVEAVRIGTVAPRPHPAFDAAVAAARRRPAGDGSWTFSRLGSRADVAPIVAAALARAVHPALAVAAAVYG